MKYYVYILYSSSLQKKYIGYTANLHQRIEAHNHSENKMWSRLGKPWILKVYFVFDERATAMAGERHLKSLRNATYMDQLIAKGWHFKGKMYQALTALANMSHQT